MPKGYEEKHGGRVVSLCSAPDWCGTLKNPGAVLLIDRSSMRMYVLLRATLSFNGFVKSAHFSHMIDLIILPHAQSAV
jgi:hypothetical protein